CARPRVTPAISTKIVHNEEVSIGVGLMARIVLFENIHPSAREVFQSAGYDEIITHAAALPPDTLREAIRGAQVLGIRSRTQIDAELIAANPDLRAIGC